MKIENFKEKLVSLCEKEYRSQPKELTANQLHCAVSKLVMEELSPAWDKSRMAQGKLSFHGVPGGPRNIQQPAVPGYPGQHC